MLASENAEGEFMKNIATRFWTKNLKPNKKGFTLIELMIVLAIIGILFGIFAAIGTASMQKAKYAVVKTDFKAFSLGFEQACKENQGITNSTADQIIGAINANLDSSLKFQYKDAACTTLATTAADFQGVLYCQRKDPYGNYYQLYWNQTSLINAFNTEIRFTIKSFGPNGKTAATYSSIDTDDVTYMIQMVNGDVKTASLGFPTGNIGTVTQGSPTTDMTKWYINP